MNFKSSFLTIIITSGLMVFGFLIGRTNFQNSQERFGKIYTSQLFNFNSAMIGYAKNLEKSRFAVQTNTSRIANSDEQKALVKERFETRWKHLQGVCQKPEYKSGDSNEISVQNRFKNIVFNRLHWCRIPKIGTTYLQHKLDQDIKIWASKNNVSSKFSKSQQKSFFLVREPYSRLVSGYLDKVITTPSFWSKVGTNIIKSQRPEASKAEKNCGNGATFNEFVSSFIESEKTGKDRNIHFIPIHDHCQVCHTHYDFIGHLETFNEDLIYILQSVGIDIKLSLSYQQQIRSKVLDALVKDRKVVNRCGDVYEITHLLWFNFQARGFISNNFKFPMSKADAQFIDANKFADIAVHAHILSQGNFDKAKQSREMLVSLYMQIPLEERKELQKIFAKDFELFGYDPQPPDIFPELF